MSRYFLTLVPQGGSPVTRSFEDWGIDDGGSFTFGNVTQDSGTLNLHGITHSDDFIYGARVKVVADGRILFQGSVDDDPELSVSNNGRALTVRLAGPWLWFKEVFTPGLLWRTGWVNPEDETLGYTYETKFLTQFTCNRDPNDNTLINSRQQIKYVLDFLIAKGLANFGYQIFDYAKDDAGLPTDISALPVLPTDMLNVTADEVIRRQFVNYDMVIGFDHSVEPPLFFARRAKDCPSRTLTFSRTPDRTGVRPGGYRIRRVKTREVNFVRVVFERDNSQIIGTEEQVYPPGANLNQFWGFTTTVPLSSYSATANTVAIQTTEVTPSDLDWWKNLLPKFTDGSEYANFAIVAGSIHRDQPGLPRMIVGKRNIPVWLPGTIGPDRVIAKFRYQKRVNAVVTSDVIEKSFSVQIDATDMNYPVEQEVGTVTVNSFAETSADFPAMAQLIWEDLSAPNWTGDIGPVIETIFSGHIGLGYKYNMDGASTEGALGGMNALGQHFTATLRPGYIEWSITCGRNDNVNENSIAERLKAERLARCNNAIQFLGGLPKGSAVRLSAVSGPEKTENEPALQEHTVITLETKTTIPPNGDPPVITNTGNLFAVMTTVNPGGRFDNLGENGNPAHGSNPALFVGKLNAGGAGIGAKEAGVGSEGYILAHKAQLYGLNIQPRFMKWCDPDTGDVGYVLGMFSRIISELPQGAASDQKVG